MQGSSWDGLSLAAGQGGSSGTPSPSAPLLSPLLIYRGREDASKGEGQAAPSLHRAPGTELQVASSLVDQHFLKKNPNHPPSKAAGFADCSGLSSVTLLQPAAHGRVSLLFLIEGQNLEAAGNCFFFFFFSPRCTTNKTTLRKGRRPWRSQNGNPKGGQQSQEGFVSTTRGGYRGGASCSAHPEAEFVISMHFRGTSGTSPQHEPCRGAGAGRSQASRAFGRYLRGSELCIKAAVTAGR